MDKEIKTDTSTGLGMLNLGSTAQEVDLNASTGAVIDPKKVAEEAKEQEIDTPLSITDESEEEEEEQEEIEQEDEEEEEEEEKGDITADDKTKENEKTETFKVLGQHFYEAGILEGYDEEMENSEEAFQGMIQKTIDKGIEDYKKGFENPVTKQFIDYLENGGNAGDFMQLMSGPDYSQVTTDDLESNSTLQKQVLQAYLIENGESAEEAEETIQAFEDAGTLNKKANTALNKLQAFQSHKRQTVLQEQKQRAEEHRKQVQEYVATLESNINSKEELAGFKLTPKTKSDLFNYITNVERDGKTKLMKDAEDPDKQLLMAFFHFNNFNFEKLEKKVKKNATNDLMSKLNRTTDTSSKQKSRTRTPAHKSEPGAPNMGLLKKLF